MKLLFSVTTPSSLWMHGRRQHYSIATDQNKLFVLQPYEQNFVSIDLKKTNIERIQFRETDKRTLADIPANDPILDTHCFHYARGKFFIYDPSQRAISMLDARGRILNFIPTVFPIFSLAATDESIVAFGPHDQHLFHELDYKGKILRSFIRSTENFSNLKYFNDKSIYLNSEGIFFFLADRRSGIIDAIDFKTGNLKKRFALKTAPVIGQILANREGTPTIVLVLNSIESKFHSISGYGENEIIAISGIGQYGITFNSELEPTRYFSLPRAGKHSHQDIFYTKQFGRDWVACLSNGEIWLLEQADLRYADKSTCLHEIQSDPLGPIGANAQSPYLPRQELEKYKDFFLSLAGESIECFLVLDADGAVLWTDLSDSKVHEGLKQVLSSIKFSPRIVNKCPVETRVGLFILIDDWPINLLNEAGDKLTTFSLPE